MTLQYLFRSASLCIWLLTLVGCAEDDGEPRHPVSGKITLKGKAVEGAIVAFTPDSSGLPASGITDASGAYKLTTRVSGDGALVGSYKVSVAKYQTKLDAPDPAAAANADPYDITNEYPDGYDELSESEKAASISKNLLPAKFAQPQTSGLSASVVEGENSFDFDLK